MVVRIVLFPSHWRLATTKTTENDGPVVPPPVDESIDLTASEAYANCFIVTEADEYRFATRKVDGSDVEGIVSVDWLWSTKNAAGNPLVSEVSYKRRYRAFHVGWYGRQYRCRAKLSMRRAR